jgi:hypothetical protein
MKSTEYPELKVAVDEALGILCSGKSPFAVVVPSAAGMWHVALSINKVALKSADKIAWVSLWEKISKPGTDEERKKRLWIGLQQLVRRQNEIAIKAQNAIELYSAKQNWSPGFKSGASLFVRYSPEHPFLRG